MLTLPGIALNCDCVYTLAVLGLAAAATQLATSIKCATAAAKASVEDTNQLNPRRVSKFPVIVGDAYSHACWRYTDLCIYIYI